MEPELSNLLELIRGLQGDPEIDLPLVRESLTEAGLEALRGKPVAKRIKLLEGYLRPVLERLADEEASFFTTFNRDRRSVRHVFCALYDHLMDRELLGVGEAGRVRALDVTARGCFGFLLFAMATVVSARDLASVSRAHAKKFNKNLTDLIQDAPVREVFMILYDPGDEVQKKVRQFWKQLRRGEKENLEFFCTGTTSFLLLCGGFAREKCVLKCLHVAFQSVRVITRDTQSYAYHIAAIRKSLEKIESENDLVVEVYHSTKNWILMEYIDGPTLREELDELKKKRNQPESEKITQQVIDWIERYALPVVDGIKLLHRIQIAHLDLSPSNIILARSSPQASEFQVRFIDLGRNYLASEAIGIVRSNERRYVAPEVRGLGPGEVASFNQEADLYSYGCFLSELCSGKLPNEAGSLPEALYSAVPFIGRLAQDLLDRSPSNRLLLARITPENEAGAPSLLAGWVCLRLKEAIRCMRELVKAGQAGKERQLVPYFYVWPAISQVRRLVWHLIKNLRSNRKVTDPMSREFRSGLAWSMICLTFFTLSILVIVSMFSKTLECTGLPEVLVKRVPDIVPDRVSHIDCTKGDRLFQTQLVSFTGAFTILGYYQGIFARLWIPRRPMGKSWIERTARVSMRGITVIPFGLILATNLWWYNNWLLALAVGAYYPAVNNNLFQHLRRRYVDKAGEPQPPLRPIPEAGQYKSDILGGWCLGMPFFATVLLVGAIVMGQAFIHLGNTNDGYALWPFGVLLAAWNMYIFLSRAGPRNCTKVRGSLSLALTLGERASCRRAVPAQQRVAKEH